MAKNDFQYAGWNSYTLQCDTITTCFNFSLPSELLEKELLNSKKDTKALAT